MYLSPNTLTTSTEEKKKKEKERFLFYTNIRCEFWICMQLKQLKFDNWSITATNGNEIAEIGSNTTSIRVTSKARTVTFMLRILWLILFLLIYYICFIVLIQHPRIIRITDRIVTSTSLKRKIPWLKNRKFLHAINFSVLTFHTKKRRFLSFVVNIALEVWK